MHLLTTHSLRPYAITRFARETNGNVVLASKFARHSDPSTTMRYIHTDKREFYQAIDEINIGGIEILKKAIIIIQIFGISYRTDYIYILIIRI